MPATPSLRSRVVAADGLRRRVCLFLEADPEVLAGIRAVRYDLGSTFTDRYRHPDKPSGDFGVEIEAYGSFTALAEINPPEGAATGAAFSEGRAPLQLTHEVRLPAPETRTPREAPGASPPVPVTPWSGVALDLFVGVLVLLLAWFAIAVWPDGGDTVRFPFGVGFRAGPEWRLRLLAGAAGGLGALLQAAAALVEHPDTGSLTASWVRWYLLRPLAGMAVALVAYALLRGGFFAPGTDPAAVASWGVAALGVAAGLASGRVTSKLTELSEALFAPVLAEPTYSTSTPEATMPTSDKIQPIDAAAAREEQRKRDTVLAVEVLRGGALSPQEIYDLADRLKNCNEFGYARRLFGRIRASNAYEGLKQRRVKVAQSHAMCTYKDPDLPAADRFERALQILDEADGLQADEKERQESLGLRGAVYKRAWQLGGQRADLERSLACYASGARYASGQEIGPQTDQGYNGINAAFMLDLLAREDARQAGRSGARWTMARAQWQEAQDIRRGLTELLPALRDKPDTKWPPREWWYHTTLAEAWLGLGEVERARQALLGYNRALGLQQETAPVDQLPPWEFESTITQLAALVTLRTDLIELLGEGPQEAEAFRLEARTMLETYLGDLAPGATRAFTGKVGLALSGGGFRASLFHLGVLAYLAERDILRRVEVLSCVSGGSIVGAQFYLEVQRLLEHKPEAEITRDDYLALVERLHTDFLTGIQTNIRSRVFSGFWSNLRAFVQPSYTTTRRLGELYELELYSRVRDGKGDAPRYLGDLFVAPEGERATFKPKYDNWRRTAKVPILVLNATTLNTGHNWQFTASWMGEPPSSLDAEIEGNYRLRRMYYWEAPRLRDRWRGRLLRLFAPPDYQRLRLGDAVAASSSVPGLFEPLVFPDLYDGKTVRLVDGGVYDNQGIASLLEQDCTLLLVSDASGQMEALDHPSGGRIAVPLRAFSISMARVRQAEFQDLAARRQSGLLKGLAFLHLKKDLDAEPVDWRECQDPHEASDEATPPERRGVDTPYKVPKAIQRLLAGIRTDLDSFTEIESFSLMTSGYRMAETEFAKLESIASPERVTRPWRFLEIEPVLEPGPGYDEVTRHLSTASRVLGKVWLLARPLTVLACALGAALLFGAWRLWQAYQGSVLVTVRGLGIFLVVLAASLLVPALVRVVRYRETLRDLGLRALLAAGLAVGFKLHLILFDPLFLRLGRARRFLAMRDRVR